MRYIRSMAKKTKPVRKYAKLSVYPSVKTEIDTLIESQRKAGGDTNLSRLLRRALMALKEKA